MIKNYLFLTTIQLIPDVLHAFLRCNLIGVLVRTIALSASVYLRL